MTAEGNPARVQVIHPETLPQESAELKQWLAELVSRGGSDLLLVPQAPATIRIEGAVSAIGDRPLSGEEIEAAVIVLEALVVTASVLLSDAIETGGIGHGKRA